MAIKILRDCVQERIVSCERIISFWVNDLLIVLFKVLLQIQDCMENNGRINTFCFHPTVPKKQPKNDRIKNLKNYKLGRVRTDICQVKDCKR